MSSKQSAKLVNNVRKAAKDLVKDIPKTKTQAEQPADPLETYDRHKREAYIRELEVRKHSGDLLAYAAAEVVKKWPPVPIPSLSPSSKKAAKAIKHDQEEIITLISDSHIGEHLDARSMGGVGVYDLDVFHKQMESYQKSLASILDVYEKIPTPNIHVAFLGDLIDGRFIYRGQTRHLNLFAMEQVLEAVRIFASHLRWLASRFERVYVHCVVGNHGRIGQKGEGHPTKDNLEWAIYHMMKQLLESQENIIWNIPETWYAYTEIAGTRFLFIHGEDIRGWMGIPHYGLQRARQRLYEWMPHDYLVCGHHHQDAKFGGHILNGAWPGPSEFSLKALQSASLPSQKFLMVHPDHGITTNRDIYLMDGEAYKPLMFDPEEGQLFRTSGKAFAKSAKMK